MGWETEGFHVWTCGFLQERSLGALGQEESLAPWEPRHLAPSGSTWISLVTLVPFVGCRVAFQASVDRLALLSAQALWVVTEQGTFRHRDQ